MKTGEKLLKLAEIKREIENCKVCKKGKMGMAVPGEGSADALIAFIGEAPGRMEAATGRPFVGRSGKLLRATIVSLGLAEDAVYITSPVKYLPVYKTPNDADIAHGMTHLSKQLAIINPSIIVLMGSVASRGVLGASLKISQEHGKIIKQGDKSYFISYHPAAAIRFRKFHEVFTSDLKLLIPLLKSIS